MLKITQELLRLAERNEALAKQQFALFVAKGNTMTVPQFLPHSDFDSSFESDFDLLLNLDEIKPEQKLGKNRTNPNPQSKS
ncbi:MAG TPA: hypothetical protein V6D37_08980 [Candidatus Sericytochromatia bacterium]